MTRIIDALPGSFQHLAGDVSRVASATCFVFLPNCVPKSACVGHWLPEYLEQEIDQEMQWRFIVVVKDDFAMAGLCLGLDFTHWNIASIKLHLPFRYRSRA
jgi:hypothetical protein